MSDLSSPNPCDAPRPCSASLGEKLSWEEICRRYPDEYVALVDYDFPNMTFTAGVVYAHHPDRKTLFEMSAALRDAALLWTGKIRPFIPCRWAEIDVDR